MSHKVSFRFVSVHTRTPGKRKANDSKTCSGVERFGNVGFQSLLVRDWLVNPPRLLARYEYYTWYAFVFHISSNRFIKDSENVVPNTKYAILS